MVALQETHLTDTLIKRFSLHVQDFAIEISHGTSNSAGVLMAIKWNVGITYCKIGEITGHALVLDITFQNTQWHCVNVYAPSMIAQCWSFWSEVTKWIIPGEMVILGDFNSITSTNDQASGNLDATSAQLQELLELWKVCELSGSHTFTYQHPTVGSRKSRIDCMFLQGVRWGFLSTHSGPQCQIIWVL